MDVSLGTLIGQATTFLVLILVTMKYVWPPLTQALEAEKALEKAEAEAEQIIRAARAKSSEIIDQAGKRGNEIVEQAKQDAIAERDRQVAAAEAEIKLATNQAREALREKLAELTITGAERVLQQELDADRHKAMLDKLATEL